MKLRQAVVLCGGLGTRIAALSGGRPKALLPVAGRPFLHHLLDWLGFHGVREALLLVGHGAEEVERAARAGAPEGLTVQFNREPAPLGTGGALKLAAGRLDDRFLMLNGDTFLNLDVAALARRHAVATPDGAVATLALVRHPHAGEKGAVEVAPDGVITRFVEKGQDGPGLINAGVYLIESAGLNDIAANRAVSLEREVFPHWMARAAGRGLRGLTTDAYFVDIGLPEDYLRVKDGFPV
jgi:NDP-sugar pyrophosphorylase family protein